jgi:hypothetical protein
MTSLPHLPHLFPSNGKLASEVQQEASIREEDRDKEQTRSPNREFRSSPNRSGVYQRNLLRRAYPRSALTPEMCRYNWRIKTLATRLQ